MKKEDVTTAERVAEAKRLCGVIRPILKGKGMEVQGAVLADLVATWLAGIGPDEMRGTVLAEWIQVTRRLVEVNEMMLFGLAGHPANGRGPSTVVPFPAPKAKQ